MQFKNSKYFSSLRHNKLEYSFGTYYLCPKFIISEVKEEIHFDWEKAEIVITDLLNFYGKNARIGFISNRINSFSTDPQNWIKVHNKYQFMVAASIVTYSDSSYKVATLEKHFSKKSVKRCQSLDEAITWMENLEELKVLT
ncbi:hypothetical protein [Algibacter pacificus]|uniref:hypothetical protein n=1 Tax=Algibacter pacificus TaxID=2599389 RepID=UPI0011CC6D95|nr:hypothetical protein [Algibacter pacificus]